MNDRTDFVTLAFVGDALTAAGLRLAGVRAYAPRPGEERAAFAQACATAAAVFVTPAVAARLDAAELEGALAALSPLVAIVAVEAPPDARPRAAARLDPAERVRRQLGVER